MSGNFSFWLSCDRACIGITMKKIVKVLLVVISYLSLMLLVGFALDKIMPMDYELISSVQSPDKTKTLYVYSVNSGASSDYSYRVTVSSKNSFDKVNKDKYFFHYDSNHGSASKDIKIEWLDSSNIKITYDKNIRAFEQKSKMGSINIQYQNKDSAEK